MAVAAPAQAPWLGLPAIEGANTYLTPPTGALQVPAVVYRPDQPWIERQQTYKAWVENYVAVCVVNASAGADGVAMLYALALAVKDAIDSDQPAMAAWEWRGAGAIVETEQAGTTYLACAVRLSFRAQY
ncbi:MAG: hypothetical protein ACOYBU_14025 [Dermatophilaceae bacterium]|jgi:hypothetical protein